MLEHAVKKRSVSCGGGYCFSAQDDTPIDENLTRGTSHLLRGPWACKATGACALVPVCYDNPILMGQSPGMVSSSDSVDTPQLQHDDVERFKKVVLPSLNDVVSFDTFRKHTVTMRPDGAEISSSDRVLFSQLQCSNDFPVPSEYSATLRRLVETQPVRYGDFYTVMSETQHQRYEECRPVNCRSVNRGGSRDSNFNSGEPSGFEDATIISPMELVYTERHGGSLC